MLLCVGGGLAGGGISVTVDKAAIQPVVARYQKVLKGTTLDKEKKKEDKIIEQAKKDGIILPTE